MQLKLHVQLQIMRGPPGIVTFTSLALAVTVSSVNSITTVLPALLRFVVILGVARSTKMTVRGRECLLMIHVSDTCCML